MCDIGKDKINTSCLMEFAIRGIQSSDFSYDYDCDSGAILVGSIATESGPTLSTPKYCVDSEMIPASL